MTRPDSGEEIDTDLEDLLVFIRDARGFDFTGYKRSTLGRRIRRRMQEVGATNFVEYRDHLEASAEEFGHVFNTILINVTSFFRDAETWAFLRQEIMPELIATADPSRGIRVWSAGCASGEEAYSLAIAFAEALGIEECAKRVKIYGTDLDEDALREARMGIYPAKNLESISPALRQKYFEPSGTQFAFCPDLRQRVIFGRHDITRDAPISRLDLLICRNTLMYFNVETQAQVIDRFHFALREGGYLFLGKAEMLLADGERFEVVSMRQRYFRRRPGVASPGYQSLPIRPDVIGTPEMREVSKKRQLRDLTLETAPLAVIGIDAEGTVVLINNQMRAMFGITTRDLGRPFHDLEISYRPVEMRSLIERADAEHRVVRVNAVERQAGSAEVEYLDIHIQPLWGTDGQRPGRADVHRHLGDHPAAVRGQAQPGGPGHRARGTAVHQRGAGDHQRGAPFQHRGAGDHQRGAAVDQRGAGDHQRGTPVRQRRARDDERGDADPHRRARRGAELPGRGAVQRRRGGRGAGCEDLVRSWNRGAEDLWGLRADEVRLQPFFGLDFGLPIDDVRDVVQQCQAIGTRTGPVELDAVNRIGRTIICTVICSPLKGSHNGDRDRDGAVLLMEETYSG